MYLQLLYWGLDHATELPSVIAKFESIADTFGAGTRVVDTWDAIKPLGDQLAPWAEELAAIIVPADADASALECQLVTAAKLGDGKLFERLKPVIDRVLPILLQLLLTRLNQPA